MTEESRVAYMKPLLGKILILQTLICCAGPSFGQKTSGIPSALDAANPTAVHDSLLLDYSLEDLVELRTHYEQETDRLIGVQDSLRLVGIRDMENFVAMYPNSPALDKVLVRLADMQYEQAVKDFVRALAQYNRLAEQYEAGELTLEPAEPFPDYSRSLELFQRIIDEFPQSALVDDAIYNKGFLLEDIGEQRKAVSVYRELVEAHPESRFAPDALMRIAEFYFRPPFDKIDTAISFYKKVLAYKESPLYDAAMYRLGWAYYKLNDYPWAIAYFTLLADDIDRVRQWDPEAKHHFPAVQDEAIEYLGISFLDYGGAEDAANFFDKIGARDYGYQVFRRIGDAYMDVKEEYQDAIDAYQFLLAMYPDTPDAPFIQAKIAQAYKQLDDDRMAYVSRSELFEKFGAEERSPDDVRDNKVRDLTERSLRENIFYLLRQAQEKDDPNLYSQAVADCREYLRTFPTDSNAVRMHWNLALTLDTKLGLHEEAFEEYIKISNVYQRAKYQKQAAENAIATADELVKNDRAAGATQDSTERVDTQRTLASSNAQAAPKALTGHENRLVLALNNYIRNFPHAPETPKMLARTGEVYYNKRQFKESLKYLKTLVKHFPDSPGTNYARFITMESYFGKGDYKSAERIARMIRANSTEYREKANLRLGEAIFFQARVLADSTHHLAAAEGYLRVLTETPMVAFADLALYNAALEYEAAKSYENAINTYSQFLDIFPGSQYALKALKNLAFDFHALGDFLNAGETYRTLANTDANDSTAQVALFNASVSFVQAQAWERVIDANNIFALRYPGSPDADKLMFDNAAHYLKLNDIGSANAIYDRFTAKFPNSPLVIEAYYYRGAYYKKTKHFDEAREQFEAALKKNSEFKTQGLETNEFIVSETMFQLAEVKFVEFEAIDFDATGAALAARIEQKKNLLTELVSSFTEVISYGTYRVPNATFKIGRAYEEFAKTWTGQEIVEPDESKKVVARTEINKTASELFGRAIASYKSGALALEKFVVLHLTADSTQPDSLAGLVKLAVADSTVQLAQRWIAACREKISEGLYQVANLYEQSLQEMLNAPVPDGMSNIEEVVYRKEVLEKLVNPLAQQVVAVHRRNIQESAEMNLENEWVDKSRQRIFAARSLVPATIYGLGAEALDVYARMAPDYEKLIPDDEDAAFDMAEQMTALVELSGSLTLKAAQELRKNLQTTATREADSLLILENEENLLKSIYQYAAKTDSLSLAAARKRAHFERLFEQTDSINYEDAYFTFDDVYFKLQEGADNLLKFGHEVSQSWLNEGVWSQKIGMALVRRDPVGYADKYGIEIETQTFVSASDWLATSELNAGWHTLEFADTLWSNAYTEGAATHVDTAYAKALWLMDFNPDVLASFDSTAIGSEVSVAEKTTELAFAQAVTRPRTVYFRKAFDITGLPVSGKIQLYLDDAFTLYINSQKVAEHAPDSAAVQIVHTHDISRQLVSGKNVIAVRVEDTNQSQGCFEASVEVQSIPDWSAMQDGWLNKAAPVIDDSKPDSGTLTE